MIPIFIIDNHIIENGLEVRGLKQTSSSSNINRIPIISLLRRFVERCKTFKKPIIVCTGCEIIGGGGKGQWAFEVICSHFVSCDNG